MKVINKIVNNREEYLELLLHELCQRGISYVLIHNELHFDDFIIRFFTFEELKSIFYLFEDCDDFLLTRENADSAFHVEAMGHRDFQSNTPHISHIKDVDEKSYYLTKKIVKKKKGRRRYK